MFLLTPFTETDPTIFTELQIDVKYPDGSVETAYLRIYQADDNVDLVETDWAVLNNGMTGGGILTLHLDFLQASGVPVNDHLVLITAVVQGSDGPITTHPRRNWPITMQRPSNTQLRCPIM